MEHVTDVWAGVRRESNGVLEPEFRVTGRSARLRLGPHPADADQRSVILIFNGVRHARIGFPNDEDRPHHRFWRRGLSGIHWIGKVEGSQLVQAANPASALPSSLTHWVILLKEETVEVIARGLEATRE